MQALAGSKLITMRSINIMHETQLMCGVKLNINKKIVIFSPKLDTSNFNFHQQTDNVHVHVESVLIRVLD